MSNFFVPGRIEVLGKHTDYAGGRSLLCAVNRGITVSSNPRADSTVRAMDELNDQEFITAMSSRATAAQGTWGSYVAAVARRISRDFPGAVRGATMRFRSDLPADAGLSSSSALVVAIALALIDANDLESDEKFKTAFGERTDLAGYLGAVENGRAFGAFPGDDGVGTFGGSEDHTAILCCKPNTLSQFSYAPVVHEGDVALADDVVFAIASSGVRANKTGGALASYNRLSRATSVLLNAWNALTSRHDATLAQALASRSDARPYLAEHLSRFASPDYTEQDLQARLDQFDEESNAIVPSAAEALAAGEYGRFGELVDRSQRLTESALRNHVDETVWLQREARNLGALGASAFGGGFGGSVWALVRTTGAARFLEEWELRYRRVHERAARSARFFLTPASDGARRDSSGSVPSRID